MPHLIVRLDRVECADTETITGADKFYLMGACWVGTKEENRTKSILTPPVSIQNGQTRHFGNNALIFDDEVDEDDTLVLTFAGYDRDGDNFATNATDMQKKLAEGVATAIHYLPFKAAPQVSEVLSYAVKYGGGMIKAFDKDDKLGELKLDTPVKDIGVDDYRMVHWYEGGLGWSTWDYKVHYQLHYTDY
ncbi:hypothetical protein ABT299_43775 [Spirillospora sp. NPDC000708]